VALRHDGRARLKLLLLIFSLAVPLPGLSQPFPAKPVRIIVPFPPGGGADALARLMAPKLAEVWKEHVAVENRSGASGHIGADFVAQAPADGTTLLMSSTASLTQKNVAQFAPVTLVSASPYVVTASPKTTVVSIQELVALARAGVDLLHVPYKGTGQALTDLLAGQVDLLFAPAQTLIQHVRAGKLKALATTGARRTETLPELPTVAESGVPGYEALGWFGVLAPAATPRPLVDRLSADANRVLADPDVRSRMIALGADPRGNTPEEFARFIREDQVKWAKLMREAGITPE